MNKEDSKETPFTQAHVLKLTTKNMRHSIDVSIQKTFERNKEFKDNLEKSTEVFNTLSVLHTLRKMIDDFQLHNKHLFTKS